MYSCISLANEARSSFGLTITGKELVKSVKTRVLV
jgi:hypothetical protein